MPRNDEATRRAARERSQARMNRSGDARSRSRVSTDSYGRAFQEADDLSQSRYSRQRQTGDSRSYREGRTGGRARASASSRASQPYRSSHTSGSAAASRSSRSSRASNQYRGSRSGQRQSTGRSGSGKQPGVIIDVPALLGRLPQGPAGIAIAVVAIVVVLFLVFGVLVPSCSRTPETAQTTVSSTTASTASSESAASASGESQGAQATQGIVARVAQAKANAQAAVEAASQVGALETSNRIVEALVELLGEEEAAKLVAQARTNADALWIAAHPDAYAFDGIEIQYKILKLAADEPAAIPYVREFPAKYPMGDAVADEGLAMDVASPSSAVPTTSIPHLYQWDRRWAYTIYSSASFGLTGCGPTSLAMVYQGLNRTVDRTPHDLAVLAEERGYMSEFNGTDSMFFLDVAGELGLTCWESYPDAANIRDELSQGHPIIVNLGPGYFTTNGHFFVLAGLADDGQVIVNDPYSVVRSSQTWDADFIAAETMAMFVYAKA